MHIVSKGAISKLVLILLRKVQFGRSTLIFFNLAIAFVESGQFNSSVVAFLWSSSSLLTFDVCSLLALTITPHYSYWLSGVTTSLMRIIYNKPIFEVIRKNKLVNWPGLSKSDESSPYWHYWFQGVKLKRVFYICLQFVMYIIHTRDLVRSYF